MLYQTERRHNRMVGHERWEDIDHPIWVVNEEADDPNGRVDGVAHFVDYLSYQF